MTIYIAGKMTGLPNYNFDRFNAKETELTKKGWRVLNPAKIGVLPDYEMYWPINSAMLDGADAVYMLDGWEDSPGARKELFYAIKIGLPVMFETSAIIGRFLGYMAHSIHISKLPDCNTCGRQRKCEYVPALGQSVRINCPHWESKS